MRCHPVKYSPTLPTPISSLSWLMVHALDDRRSWARRSWLIRGEENLTWLPAGPRVMGGQHLWSCCWCLPWR